MMVVWFTLKSYPSSGISHVDWIRFVGVVCCDIFVVFVLVFTVIVSFIPEQAIVYLLFCILYLLV